uniref:Uncharacterized protein n=1 Tax=Ananas comosus var. bracteatus TaxID=296719 RepID=A0A6V7QSI7_ANACO
MRTIIYQSNVRAMDSVGGCYRIVLELERQVELYTAELQLVLQQLAVCRAQAQAAAAAAPLSAELGLNVAADVDDGVVYNNNLFGNNNFVPIAPHQQQQQQQYYNYFCYDSDGENSTRFNNNVIVNFNNENNFGNIGDTVEDALVSSSINFQQEQMQKQLEEVKLEELDVKPLVDVFEAGQSFIRENEEEQLKSSASSLCRAKMVEKEDLNTMEHVQEHDLKGAASLFTLTNGSSSAIE